MFIVCRLDGPGGVSAQNSDKKLEEVCLAVVETKKDLGKKPTATQCGIGFLGSSDLYDLIGQCVEQW